MWKLMLGISSLNVSTVTFCQIWAINWSCIWRHIMLEISDFTVTTVAYCWTRSTIWSTIWRLMLEISDKTENCYRSGLRMTGEETFGLASGFPWRLYPLVSQHTPHLKCLFLTFLLCPKYTWLLCITIHVLENILCWKSRTKLSPLWLVVELELQTEAP